MEASRSFIYTASNSISRMFVGHSFLAIAIAGITCLLLGFERKKALSIALAAGFFAALPDVDIIYAFKEVAGILTPGKKEIFESFWAASTVTHRNLTHSLVTGLLGSALFTAYYSYRNIFTGSLLTGLMIFYGYIFGGALISGLFAVFALLGVLLAESVTRISDMSVKGFLLASGIGLLSHPFGDLFTGTPPALLEPLNFVLLTDRITLFADPTINFLAVFILELGTIWAGIVTVFYLKERSLKKSFRVSSLSGLFFGPAALFIDPSISNASAFVFSIVLVSTLTVIFQAGVDIWTDSYNTDNIEEIALSFAFSMTSGVLAFIFFLAI